MKKRVLSLLLALIMVVSVMPATPASAVTTSDAAQWLLDHNGWYIDFDNVYGGQCVDLVKRYCNDLFGWYLTGHAWDWAWMDIPTGWQRIWLGNSPGFIPQPGDIVVWNQYSGPPAYTDKLGHVGIVYSADANGMVTYEQNVEEGDGNGNGTYVHQLYRPYTGVYGFVRPPISNSGSIPTPTPTPASLTLDDPWVGFAVDTNAQIGSFIRNGGSPVYCPQFGLKVWEKATGRLVVDHTENIDASAQGVSEIKIWVNLTNELGVTLKPGTEYEFQFSAMKDGRTFTSSKSTFTTTGQAAPTPTPTPTPSPTPAPYSFKPGTVRMENLTATNGVFCFPYTVQGGENLPNSYTICRIHIYKFDKDGEWALLAMKSHKYMPDDLTDGEHVIRFDMHEYGIQLEPGTKYAITGFYSYPHGLLNGGKDFLFTTLAETATPSPSSTPDGSPSPSPDPGTPTPDPWAPSDPTPDPWLPSNPTPDPWEPSTPTPRPVRFEDVKESDYFSAAVIWAVGEGITSGTSSTTFSPGRPCTRAQIMTFIWAYKGRPSASQEAGFFDMPSVDAFRRAISWAVENQITGGVGNNQFGPNRACTRVQAVTFLWVAAGRPEPRSTATFSDMPGNPAFRKAISWAVENKITGGMGNNRFGTNRPCTRGQIAMFLYAASKAQ